jgi:Na+/melibiose symporter-like transporter
MNDTPAEAGARLDLVGTALSALGLGAIVLGVLKAGTWGFVMAKPDAPKWFGLSPVIWLIFAGGLVLVLFVSWERSRLQRGEGALIEPAMLRNLQLRNGITSFLFMFLIQAGVFFTIPLFLSVALGVSAVETGVRLLPLSLSLLLFAAGIPRLRPNANPRRVIRAGFLMLFAGLVLLVGLLDVGAGPQIVTWPLLLAGAGLGAMASQLGAVTVSSLPDEKSGEVGGLQNTGTQLGASIGTALAGAVLISALTASFFTGIQNNPNVPESVVSKARTQLASGVPFTSDADLKAALQKANVPPATVDEIVKVNEKGRIDGLRIASAVLALLALVAIPFSHGIPAVQPGAEAELRSPPA